MHSNDRLRHYYAEQLQSEPAAIPASWSHGFWAGFGFAFVLNMCLWLLT